MAGDRTLTTEERAAMTEGYSHAAIYNMVTRVIAERHPARGTLLDVGCGVGTYWKHAAPYFERYVGADVVHYAGFPAEWQFALMDPDTGRVPLPDGLADAVVCLETIEHVENPRALYRELTRLAKPGGLVIVTTPNQLSILNKVTLVVKNRHNAFQDGTGNAYPTHITPMIEIDMIRIAQECGHTDLQLAYSNEGRIPGLAWHWPFGLGGRAFSENVLLSGLVPQR